MGVRMLHMAFDAEVDGDLVYAARCCETLPCHYSTRQTSPIMEARPPVRTSQELTSNDMLTSVWTIPDIAHLGKALASSDGYICLLFIWLDRKRL